MNLALLLFLLGMSLGTTAVLADDNPAARIAPTGEFLEFEQIFNGQTVKSFLPLHRSAGGRYFSAGVGLEERSVQYPPFPLKIVLTAGGKPFLSGVAITIQPSHGGTAIAIPREEVEGPWLFVDCAPGLYDVTAADGEHVQRLKGVKVEAGKQKVVYFRWTEDHGITGRVPAE